MKKKDLERELTELGWWLDREGGDHEVWTNGHRKVAVPRHREINEITAKQILRQAK